MEGRDEPMRVFIAASMKEPDSGTRELALEIRKRLVERYGEGSVYLACHEHPTPEDYERPRDALEESEREIRGADGLVLLSPNGMPWGTLVEVGMALALGKPILALVLSGRRLPYFLREGARGFTILTAPTPESIAEWGAVEVYFRRIRAFIDLRCTKPVDDELTDEEARAQLESRLPALESLRVLDATTAKLLGR